MSTQRGETTGAALDSVIGDRELLARVSNLRLHFDTDRGVVRALDGVNLDVFEGEILALVGETGCGKTITARSFMQLVPTPPGRYPEGSVTMRTGRSCPECDGEGCPRCYGTGEEFENLLDVPSDQMNRIRGDRIALIFQDPTTALNPSLTVEDQIAESILAHQSEEVLASAGIDPSEFNPLVRRVLRDQAALGRSTLQSLVASIPPLRKHKRAIRSAVRERIAEVLRQTQIPNAMEVMGAYPHELSGGQQQRVMIATALVAKPDLLIADEATTALDVTTQARILELIDDLQDDYDTSLLYITHDLNLVNDIADRVAVMYAGSIVETGDVDQVYGNPLHPYTRGLIGSIPSEGTVDEKLREIEGSIPDLTNPPAGCRFCTRCPEVMDHCRDEDPPVVKRERGRYVACHLYADQEEV
ncbi:MAG: ABC transporter ATP-binding protein [Salinigranum sp.]